MAEQDPDQELGRDIGYALAQSPFKVKGQRIEALRHVAAGVVRHLRMAGWIFTLRPPDDLHGPSLPPASITARANRDAGVDDPEDHDVK
jgi:hypothetical protein